MGKSSLWLRASSNQSKFKSRIKDEHCLKYLQERERLGGMKPIQWKLYKKFIWELPKAMKSFDSHVSIRIRWEQLNFLLNGQAGELFRVGKIIEVFRVDTSRNRLIDHQVKELVLLCQLKLHMKPTISHYSVNQQCQVH